MPAAGAALTVAGMEAILPHASPRWPAAMPDADLAGLLRGYQACGGLLSADRVAMQMRACCSQPVSVLAHWIVQRRVVSIAARGQTLLPVFQFERRFTGLRPGLDVVLAELSDVLDDLEVARWFVSPNHALSGGLPADWLCRAPQALHDVARLDRFVCRGS